MEDKNELINAIRELAREKNAIILAHNYQVAEVQDIADLTGDSLALSIQASKTYADIIIFCGVHFMAEAASIVCPDKKVIIPVAEAGCAMADMLTADQLRAMKDRHPGMPVVTYVNSSAEVKAESDICCTSANAIQVVKWTGAEEVIMTPDRNLANWVRLHTKQVIHAWDGFCPIHDELSVKEIRKAMDEHPEAILMAHPECSEEVLKLTDVVRSTSGMLAYAHTSSAEEFIVATENGLLHPLQKENPEKRFYAASPEMICKDMKKTGLSEILNALESEKTVIKVPENIKDRAYQAVERMLQVPRD